MWPAMFWKLGHFLCSNISLDFFLMSELWRLAFLLAVQSIPKNTTWVLWLGDWRFFKQLFITNKLQKWWKLAFLCIFCMKIAFTLMHFILQTTFNTSTNLWLKSQLSTYLSFFGSGNVSETILPHFLMKISYFLQKTTTDRYVKIENLKNCILMSNSASPYETIYINGPKRLKNEEKVKKMKINFS